MANLPAAGAITALATNAEAQQLFEALRDWLSQLPASAEEQLTIASGTITPATRDQGSIAVETEAAVASDDLANIAQTNVQAGALLLLRAADASHTVVVKHAAGGAGQILLQYDTDFSLDDTDKWLLLKRIGTEWVELFRNWGNDTIAQRQSLGFKKGADVASASALALGTDGNYFDITGTTAITSINTVGVGTVVKLHFDAALTITHHATDLILPDGANITTAAGDEAEFVEYATGDWRLTSYSRPYGNFTDYSSAATIVGWSSYTTKLIYYKDIGKTRYVYVNIDGTSNSTSTSFTVPSACSGSINYGGQMRTDDNGNINLGHFTLASGASTVNCYYSPAALAWTASGTKRLLGQFTYQLP